MYRKFLTAALAIPAAVVLTATASTAGASAATSHATVANAASSGATFTAKLSPVVGNHVTGSGWTSVTLRGDMATITMHVKGLILGPHAAHIHFKGEGECPDVNDLSLHNGRLSMSTTDGLADYGPIGTSLTTRGDTSPTSALAITRFPQVGTYTYVRTIKLSDAVAHAVRTNNAVIVVHGIDYNHNNKYDSVLGVSDLTNTLPMEATSPAICGPLS